MSGRETGVVLRLFPAGNGAAPGIEVRARAGENLARAIWLSGAVPPRPLCLGLACCGLCRVRYAAAAPLPLPEDEAALGPQQTAEGWRLACRRSVPSRDAACGELALELPADAFAPPDAASPKTFAPERAFPPGQKAALGVDLGTTTIQWRAVALSPDGKAAEPPAGLAEGGLLNPQAGAGADIMSRLALARSPDGLEILGMLARKAVGGIIGGLKAEGLAPERICVAANTAMTDIFLGRNVDGLCAAPYRRSHAGGDVAEVPGLGTVIIPPLPAPFVGGDLSAGLAVLLADACPRPFVLADLGTNGELALLTEDERLYLASVPLGPALEGIGPERGSQAGPGVVVGFRLGPQGLQALLFDDAHGAGARPRAGEAAGISATGYISLLALLFRLGVLDQTGHFARPEALHLPLARAIAREIRPSSQGPRLMLPQGLWLGASDVELLLKVKAAFAVALEAICSAAGVASSRLRRLALAGALGQHLQAADLKDLGFAPGVPEKNMSAVGNTALAGACLLAASPCRLEPLAALCQSATVLELTEMLGFQKSYLARMRLGE